MLIGFFFVLLIVEAQPALSTSSASSGSCSTTTGTRRKEHLRRAAAGRRHADHLGDRAADRRARRGRDRAVPHRARARAALRGPLTILVELLAAVPSVVYGLWGVFVLIPKLKPAEQWFADTFDFLPFVGRRRRRAQLLHRRADPRDHDPADRLGDLARGHRDGAGRPQGGRARARRDALGDDPHGGAAVLARGHHRRRDARASAARSARRSP